ncbi:hypothetical protein J0795_29550 [Bacillus paranthracis]|uniref:hypothetical protein n=1 Tax=Bacillus paranthracis TaxID=2026186 RepID=UPI002FDC16CA
MEAKNKLENIIWHIKTNRVVLGDKRTLNDVLGVCVAMEQDNATSISGHHMV